MTGKIRKVIGKAKQKLSSSRTPQAPTTSEPSQPDAVDEMIDESFPASDPPSSTPTSAIAGAKRPNRKTR